MSVELKILVPLEEWKLLKSKAKTHENCDDTSKELEILHEINVVQKSKVYLPQRVLELKLMKLVTIKLVT